MSAPMPNVSTFVTVVMVMDGPTSSTTNVTRSLAFSPFADEDIHAWVERKASSTPIPKILLKKYLPKYLGNLKAFQKYFLQFLIN